MTNLTNTRSFRQTHADADDPTSVERSYVEIIYYLQSRHAPVMAVQLARWLQVRPPSVTHILQRLLAKGYIFRDPNGAITLTPFGQTLAETIVRRHRLLERFLYDVIGIPWHQLHQESVRLEPAVSTGLQARIEALVGSATVCPHGNPIPGQGVNLSPDEVRLDAAPVGAQFTVVRIDEEAGEDPCMLQRFWITGMLPETVCIRLPDPRDGIAVRMNGRRIVLSRRAAALVWGTATL